MGNRKIITIHNNLVVVLSKRELTISIKAQVHRIAVKMKRIIIHTDMFLLFGNAL